MQVRPFRLTEGVRGSIHIMPENQLMIGCIEARRFTAA
jgi:hypothetical protein